jgi:hypothetical protein
MAVWGSTVLLRVGWQAIGRMRTSSLGMSLNMGIISTRGRWCLNLSGDSIRFSKALLV